MPMQIDKIKIRFSEKYYIWNFLCLISKNKNLALMKSFGDISGTFLLFLF